MFHLEQVATLMIEIDQISHPLVTAVRAGISSCSLQ
jgi:hypothetical protein